MVAEASPLTMNVLLLNRHWQALRITTAMRAMTLLYRNMAEAVAVEDGRYATYDFDNWVELSAMRADFEPEKHDWIHTVRFQIAVPRIIRVLGYDKLPRVQVKLNRRNLFARDGNRCQYCGKKYPTSELSIDHVVPRSQGGGTTWENVVSACVRCNVRKGGRTPEQAHLRLVALPRRPKRSPVLTIKLSEDKYASWKQFVDFAYWNVELK